MIRNFSLPSFGLVATMSDDEIIIIIRSNKRITIHRAFWCSIFDHWTIAKRRKNARLQFNFTIAGKERAFDRLVQTFLYKL